MTKIERQIRYAYLATLVGVVLATITTAFTTISSFLFRQASRRPTVTRGNFTGPGQFGNFTRTPQFGNMSPSGGFVNNLAILAVIIAVVGVLWLGLSLRSLRKSSLESHKRENASTGGKPETE